MDVERKSTGELIDALCTVSQRIFQDTDRLGTLPDTEAGVLAKNIQILNSRRNELMRAISRRVDKEDSGMEKTYKNNC